MVVYVTFYVTYGVMTTFFSTWTFEVHITVTCRKESRIYFLVYREISTGYLFNKTQLVGGCH